MEHQGIFEKVLQQCVVHGLAHNLLKREFNVHENIFLGHVIHGQEVKIDASKVKTMSKWPILTKKKEVPAFLGFSNYCCRFIINYSAKACPPIDLIKNVHLTQGHTQ